MLLCSSINRDEERESERKLRKVGREEDNSEIVKQTGEVVSRKREGEECGKWEGNLQGDGHCCLWRT